MIKLTEVLGYPSLKYHLDNGLPLNEHVYRGNETAFVNLFAEARESLSNEEIELTEEDQDLIETTDIGEYAQYNGMKVPLDLPMVSKKYNPLFEIGALIDSMIENEDTIDEASCIADMIDFDQIKEMVELIGGQIDMDKFRKAVDVNNESFDYSGFDMLKASVGYMNEAEYQGKKVKLDKPKRGGTKKYYVYVKDGDKVIKVAFTDGGIPQKNKVKGAMSAYRIRHKCSTKSDKTKSGYWTCNLMKYAKSLGI